MEPQFRNELSRHQHRVLGQVAGLCEFRVRAQIGRCRAQDHRRAAKRRADQPLTARWTVLEQHVPLFTGFVRERLRHFHFKWNIRVAFHEARPASVSATRRVVRVRSFVPTRFSRLCTARLIATLGTPSARAEAVKEPSSTTWANAASSEASQIVVRNMNQIGHFNGVLTRNYAVSVELD